jgi:hypothetical protein
MRSCLYRSRAAGVDFLANTDFDEVFLPNPSVHKGEGALLRLMEDLAYPSTQTLDPSTFEERSFLVSFLMTKDSCNLARLR